MTNIKKLKDRRKTRWEIELHPGITFLIMLFVVGMILVWLGIYERRFNHGSGTITHYVTNIIAFINGWISSF